MYEQKTISQYLQEKNASLARLQLAMQENPDDALLKHRLVGLEMNLDIARRARLNGDNLAVTEAGQTQLSGNARGLG